jgi:hypothetical protein
VLHGFGRNVHPRKDTVFNVAFEDDDTSAFKAGAGGGELGEDVFAGAALFEHAANRTNLTFDAGEPVKNAFIAV